MDFSVRKEVDGAATILHLQGVLDITTTHLISPYLENLEKGTKTLVFDFSSLDFLDSTGIGSIINAIHLSQSEGFTIHFEGVSDLVDQVFNMVGVYKILEAIQGEGV